MGCKRPLALSKDVLTYCYIPEKNLSLKYKEFKDGLDAGIYFNYQNAKIKTISTSNSKYKKQHKSTKEEILEAIEVLQMSIEFAENKTEIEEAIEGLKIMLLYY